MIKTLQKSNNGRALVIDEVSVQAHRRPRFQCAVVLFVLLSVAGPTIVAGGVPMADPGLVENLGYEQIIAGPDVPDSQGYPTDSAYQARRVALSEDGSRIWFTMFNQWDETQPDYLIVTMLTDGTGEMTVDITPDVDYFEGNTIYLETSASGDRAIFHSATFNSVSNTGTNLMATATLPVGPGDPEAVLFAEVSDMRRTINEAYRLTDDGSTVLFADTRNRIVGSFDTEGFTTLPTVLADRSALARDGNEPSSLKDFDMSGSGGEWWTFAYDFYSGEDRYWLNRGTGPSPGAAIAQEDLPLGDLSWSDWLEVSDDGEVLVYCPDYDAVANDPQGCWIQRAGTSSWTRIEGDEGHLGQPVLADGGDWAYVTDQWNQGTSYGYRVSTSRPSTRRVAGSQRLAGSSRPEFDLVRMSDDGRVLAAPVEDLGIYVQHDGSAPPSGFPTLSSISSAYDSGSDELVLTVTVAPSSADLERIYTLPLFRGIEPSRILEEGENPLYWDRNGGGVNLGTVFSQVGTSDVWERRIPMQGKIGLLTTDFAIRIVAVDSTGHRTTYYDYVTVPLFSDGFESGNFSAWSSSTN